MTNHFLDEKKLSRKKGFFRTKVISRLKESLMQQKSFLLCKFSTRGSLWLRTKSQVLLLPHKTTTTMYIPYLDHDHDHDDEDLFFRVDE